MAETDASTAIAFESLLRIAILHLCSAAPDPEAELERWIADIRHETDAMTRFAMTRKMAETASANLITAAATMSEFAEDLKSAFQARRQAKAR